MKIELNKIINLCFFKLKKINYFNYKVGFLLYSILNKSLNYEFNFIYFLNSLIFIKDILNLPILYLFN